MKKKSVLFVFLMLLSFPLFAQERYEIDHEFVESEDLRTLLEFKGIEYIRVNLSGDINGKKGKIRENVYRNGKVDFTDYDFFYPVDEDTLTVHVMLERIDQDKIDVLFRTPYRNVRSVYEVKDNGQYVPLDINIKTDERILPAVPVIGITNGLVKKISMNGQDAVSHDYCGIRDAELHPADWHTLPNMSDEYIYFEIIFE